MPSSDQFSSKPVDTAVAVFGPLLWGVKAIAGSFDTGSTGFPKA
jgi:hypothetical protein